MGIFDIFKNENSSKNENSTDPLLDRLTKKYGNVFGKAINSCTFEIGMTTEMIEAPATDYAEIENEPTYANDSYYGAVNFEKKIIDDNKQEWIYMEATTLIIENDKIVDILGDYEGLSRDIKKLLLTKGHKMPASDIDAHLKFQNVEKVKEMCEDMYLDGIISRTGNYRYFILTEEKKKPKKASTKKADPTSEIRKYAKLKDDGIITEEEFQAKKKELLGL